ncbi:Tripeptidyl aminopeptidase [Madurella mycetomatis]|uniref:Tripeptidyl aminopeptidase n=1 Tax=Madurella mycetomatis TaxID=100816 RepID=A0A175VRL6_9PEZI|nr:Tripeptidyl aminopeptidase [Madurella mycetomatis]
MKGSVQVLWSVAALFATNTSAFFNQRQTADVFSWASIIPSKDLHYHPCYGSFRCARLQVPLDWTTVDTVSNRNSSSAWATIAIISLPASVPETDSSFGGTVIMNPGGPGVSGIATMLGLGQTMQGVLDGNKHYELLSFDPRGVGMSTPRADCYGGDNFRRAADALQHAQAVAPLTDFDGLGLRIRYAAAEGLGKLCEETVPGSDSIFAHMSTASVARDMLEIVERVDQRRNSNRLESPLLQYWGFSYGTVLGQVFASLFPDRVGKMVLDGIGDIEDLLTGTWKTSTADAEKVMDQFYQTCLDAGPMCPLRQETDRSIGDIRSRVISLLTSLEQFPIPTTYDGRIQLATSHLIRETIRNALYDPLGQFEILAAILAESIAGNYTRLLSTRFVSQSSACSAPDTADPPSSYTWISDASVGIFCADTAATAGDRNMSWAENVIHYHANQSITTGEVWSHFLLSCVQWPFAPKFTLPVSSAKTTWEGSTPLLIVSTRYDPATPLGNAYALSRRYEGSAVVVQESVGHTAFIASRSRCTEDYIRTYFETGKVPANDTACQPDCVPRIPRVECPQV